MKNFLIVLCMVLVIGGTGYSIYYQVENHNKENETTNNENTDNKKDNEVGENVDINSDIVTTLMNKFAVLNDPFVAGSYSGYLYKKDNYTVNDIDNNVKLMLATEQIYLKDSSFKSGNFPIIKTKVEMQNEMQNIFGNSVIYADSNITLNCKGVGLYDENNQTYTFTEPEGCGGTLTPHIESKAVSATKYSDKLEIVEKMAYIDYTEGTNGLIANVHKNVNDTSIIGTLSDNDDIFTLYGDKLDSYKYSFKYENGNYYFESIEKIS